MKKYELGLSVQETVMLEMLQAGLSKDNEGIMTFLNSLDHWHQLLPCRSLEVNSVRMMLNSIALKICYLYDFKVDLIISNFKEYVLNVNEGRDSNYQVKFSLSGNQTLKGRIVNMDRLTCIYDFVWAGLTIKDIRVEDLYVQNIQSNRLNVSLIRFSYIMKDTWEMVEEAGKRSNTKFSLIDLDDVQALDGNMEDEIGREADPLF